MEKRMIRKCIVLGIILLFVGASVVSSTNSNVELVDVIDEIGNLNLGTHIFYPTDDAYIKHTVPNANLGDFEYFRVRNEYGATGGGFEYSGLIKFDISSLSSGVTINSATLYIFYVDYNANNPVGRAIHLFRATSDWDEMTVTWNTQPPYATQASASSHVPSSAGWMLWDVKSDIEDFVSGQKTNYGWKVTDDNYWGGFDIPNARFRTKEYGNYIPYLEIETYAPPTAYIDSITPNPANEGEPVTFIGHGTDHDGNIISYNWRSSIDGQLSTQASFTTSSLTIGTHTIYFKVRDNDYTWSNEDTETLIILENQPPTAYIDSITPNPAGNGEQVSFIGHGEDIEGPIIGYNWRSSIDGQLSTQASFTTTSLTLGTHTIYFKVKDDDNIWSNEVMETLVIIENQPPSIPYIDGPTSGKAGISHTYSASSTDPNGDQIWYWFDWGDDTNTGWVGPYTSGSNASESHIWNAQGDYHIKVKAKDSYDAESLWGTLDVTMPVNLAKDTLDISDGLLGYWSFDFETAEDESGNSNDGTVNGAVSVDGISGKALDFDGVNDYVDITDSSDFEFANQGLTFSAWVQIVDNADHYRGFMTLADASDQYGIPKIYLAKSRSGYMEGGIYFQLQTPTENTFVYSDEDGNTLPKNEWIHVMGVIDYPSELKLYINGELQGSNSLVDFDMSNANNLDLNFGSYPYRGWHDEYGRHNGLIDEVRIYDRALSEDEIQELYNNPGGLLKTTIMIGRIHNLDTDVGDLMTFEALKLRCIQFSPFEFKIYSTGEKIKISEEYKGILTPSFAFGLFNSNV